MRRALAVLAFAVVIAAVPAAARADGRLFSVEAPASSMTFHVVHKFHKFDGTTHDIDGRAKLLPDGAVQAMVRIKVESFDSANGNRDAHMKETLDTAKFPYVEFKGVTAGVKPSTFPWSASVTLKGVITFHGVQQPKEVPVKVTFANADHATVEGSFDFSLESFKVERPTLLFVPLEDKVDVDFKLELAPAK